jgi:hypothetical protein
MNKQINTILQSLDDPNTTSDFLDYVYSLGLWTIVRYKIFRHPNVSPKTLDLMCKDPDDSSFFKESPESLKELDKIVQISWPPRQLSHPA